MMAPAAERSGRSAVIACAGAGLGRDVALALSAKGCIILGTAGSPTEVRDLRNASGGRAALFKQLAGMS